MDKLYLIVCALVFISCNNVDWREKTNKEADNLMDSLLKNAKTLSLDSDSLLKKYREIPNTSPENRLLFARTLESEIDVMKHKNEVSSNIEDINPKGIPGITAADVHGNFTNKGFTLTKNIGSNFSTWTCKLSDSNKEFIVVASGGGPQQISTVEGTVLNYSSQSTSDAGKDFLGYLASLQYTNSQPGTAKEWVLKNFDNGGSTIIGGVKFELFAKSERSRVLVISGI